MMAPFSVDVNGPRPVTCLLTWSGRPVRAGVTRASASWSSATRQQLRTSPTDRNRFPTVACGLEGRNISLGLPQTCPPTLRGGARLRAVMRDLRVHGLQVLWGGLDAQRGHRPVIGALGQPQPLKAT
jgi:hypothetical protein